MARKPKKSRRVSGDVEKSASSSPSDTPPTVKENLTVAPVTDRVTESRHAVFANLGPGTYRGDLVAHKRRAVLPVGVEMSFPPEVHEQAAAEGLTFVRWAG